MTSPSAEPASAAREEALVKIACIQMEPVVGERERNVRRSLELLEEAAVAGARLVVLPELCNSGYMFRSRAEAFALADRLVVMHAGRIEQAGLTPAGPGGALFPAGFFELAEAERWIAGETARELGHSDDVPRFLAASRDAIDAACRPPRD